MSGGGGECPTLLSDTHIRAESININITINMRVRACVRGWTGKRVVRWVDECVCAWIDGRTGG